MEIFGNTKPPFDAKEEEFFTYKKARPLTPDTLTKPLKADSIGIIAICAYPGNGPTEGIRFIYPMKIMIALDDVAERFGLSLSPAPDGSERRLRCIVRDEGGSGHPLEFATLSEVFDLLAAHFGKPQPSDQPGSCMELFDRRDAVAFTKSIMHAVWPSFDWGDPEDAGTEYAPRQGVECGIDFTEGTRAPAPDETPLNERARAAFQAGQRLTEDQAKALNKLMDALILLPQALSA